MVSWLHEHVSPVDPDDMAFLVLNASRLGDLKTLKRVLKRANHGSYLLKGLLNSAACGGQIKVLEWAIDRFGVQLGQSEMLIAVSYGQLKLVQWLFRNHVGCVHSAAIARAAKYKHFATLKWALNKLITFLTDLEAEVVDHLAGYGQLDITQRLYDLHLRESTTAAMDNAARNGHLEVAKWLHDHWTVGCTTAAMDGAAEQGHLDVVQWLHSNRSEGCTTNAMDMAALNGHLEVLQWLNSNRLEDVLLKQWMVRREKDTWLL